MKTGHCKELRTKSSGFRCDCCKQEFPPSLACAVFEAFYQDTDGKPAWRVQHWLCLQCADKSPVPNFVTGMVPSPKGKHD